VAPLPNPEPGLVFRYDYLRVDEGQAGVENGKERPVCVIMTLAEGETFSGVRLYVEEDSVETETFVAGPNDILVVPIQSDPPNKDQLGLKLKVETKRLIGLPDDRESYVILSEINIDTWPNAGIKNIPNKPGIFAYPGKMPVPILSAMAKAIIQLREKRLMRGIVRHP
jgi:hypothetical protein